MTKGRLSAIAILLAVLKKQQASVQEEFDFRKERAITCHDFTDADMDVYLMALAAIEESFECLAEFREGWCEFCGHDKAAPNYAYHVCLNWGEEVPF